MLESVPARWSQRIRVRYVVNPEMPAPRRRVLDCGRWIAQAAARLLCDDANEREYRPRHAGEVDTIVCVIGLQWSC